MSLVEAIYNFKGKNNDELNFKKNDVITVSQKEEGGWWEGTLDGRTGWFPSNFVKEFRPSGEILSLPIDQVLSNGEDLVAKQKSFQLSIMKDIIESERNFIKECWNLVEQYLKPLEKLNLLSCHAYLLLLSNYEEVIRIHQNLLSALESSIELKQGAARFGKVFLTQAPFIKSVHLTYCSSHPKAVTVIEKYKEELSKYMETKGATPPGLLTLTTGLSRPFRRLERYAVHLQELEKHLEESHPDRGDTQRSSVVYKDVAKACASTRKERELALEVLSGNVRQWEGDSPASLGDIIHVGMVTISPENSERYFVLFPGHLIILTTSARLSAFVFEKRMCLAEASTNRIVGRSNSFELIGPNTVTTVTCLTKEEQEKWLESIHRQIRLSTKSMIPVPAAQTQPPIPERVAVHRVPSNPRLLPNPPTSLPLRRSSVVQPPTQKGEFSAPSIPALKKQWMIRPRPPVRVNNDGGTPRQHVRRGEADEETQLLTDVIDSYFSSTNPRQNDALGRVGSPMLVPEEEKILVEEMDGETVVVKEKTLVDTVYMMKDQVRDMQSDLSSLTRTVQTLVSDQSEMKALLKCYLQNNNLKDGF